MRRLMLTGLAMLCLAVPSSASGALSLVQIGSFSSPVYVTAPPGDTSRLFVVEQGGKVRLLVDGTLQSTPFADLTSKLTSGGERGLLSIAFAPDYATSGLLYAYFTNTNGDVEVDELRRSGANPNVIDSGYARTVLTVAHPGQSNHNGGQLQFGPDGALYAGTGDGGGGGDPNGNGQNDASHLGKLLKLDLQGNATNFAKGLRNPFRFSFDRTTGDLIIGDVGQSLHEEVDFAGAPGDGAGFNYGWNRYEGNAIYNSSTTISGTATFPVIDHTHSDGWCSLIGGYVVRDTGVSELLGKYVYSDNCKGDLYAATLPGAQDDGPTGLHVDATSSFGEDASGRVYVASLNGPVYRIAGTPVPAGGGSGGGGAGGGGTGPGTQTGRALALGLDARTRLRLESTSLRVGVSCTSACAVTLRTSVFGTKSVVRKRSLPAGRTVLRVHLAKRLRHALAASLRRHRKPRLTLRLASGATTKIIRVQVTR